MKKYGVLATQINAIKLSTIATRKTLLLIFITSVKVILPRLTFKWKSTNLKKFEI